MRSPIAIPIVLLAALPSLAGIVRSGGQDSPASGAWSAAAVNLFPSPKERPVRIPSPDGSALVLMEENDLFVKVGEKTVFHAQHAPPAEIVWAPDSSAFTVSWGEGGEEGTWCATAYLLESGGVRAVELAPAIVEQFLPEMRCREPEIPDVGVVGWISASRILVAARVPERPDCPEPGRFAAYLVTPASGAVERSVAPTELREKHRSLLGALLRGY